MSIDILYFNKISKISKYIYINLIDNYYITYFGYNNPIMQTLAFY